MLKTLILLVTVIVTGLHIAEAQQPINVLFDCSHWYSFRHVSSSNYQTHLWPDTPIHAYTSLNTIHGNDVTNMNVLVVYLNDNLPYLKEDGEFLQEFANKGGGVWFVANGRMGKSPRFPENPGTCDAMTGLFGMTFQSDASRTDANVTLPMQGTDIEFQTEKGFAFNQMSFDSDWKPILKTRMGVPLMITKEVGKGRVAASGFNPFELTSSDPSADKKTFSNSEILKQFVLALGNGKQVSLDPNYKTCGFAASEGYRGEISQQKGALLIRSSKYLLQQVETMNRAWEEKVRPVLEDMTGYTFDDWLNRRGMKDGVEFLMLPVAGSGFAGGIVGLGVLQPGSETELSAYYGILGHEMAHFLDAPYSEPLNEESMAIYDGQMVERILETKDNLEERLAKAYVHPLIYEFDPVRHRSGEAAKKYQGDKTLTFGKYMILMRHLAEGFGGEEVRRNYYQLKKYLLPWPADQKKWGPHTSAYLWSIACSTDLQPLFRAYNMQIDWNQLEYPELRELPFDMLTVARQKGIPEELVFKPAAADLDQLIEKLLTAIGRSPQPAL